MPIKCAILAHFATVLVPLVTLLLRHLRAFEGARMGIASPLARGLKPR